MLLKLQTGKQTPEELYFWGQERWTFLIARSCSFWSQNSAGTRAASNAQRSPLAVRAPPVTNPSAQGYPQRPPDLVVKLLHGDLCLNWSIMTEKLPQVCHLSPLNTVWQCLSFAAHPPAPQRSWNLMRGWAQSRGGRAPADAGGLEDLSCETQTSPTTGRATQAILKES